MANKKFWDEIGLPAIKNDERLRLLRVQDARVRRDAKLICAAAFEHAARIVDQVAQQQDIDYGAANTGGAESAAEALRKFAAKHYAVDT
jgi:hypothetical protein